ncbi:hypothetical protein DID88_005374 [Monilinia fructigena]|uniref:Rhodopsin domain-containing protein n=1 Tax=Monilinia fructigena TaxID=38457 RepID=A0A395J0E3_9HELO|nr:hypothetical protein DID88_005374 [Monilinia fructigena]
MDLLSLLSLQSPSSQRQSPRVARLHSDMAVVTPENHGPLLNVAMWILSVPMVIIALAKVYTKYETIHKLQIDDYLGLVAMLSSVAQCISIPPSELNRFYIAQYAGNIMYTLAILLTKLSSLCFFICLTGEGSTKQRVVHGSIVCVAAWSFISIIVILLQCHFPDPWIYRAPECIDVEAFWIFNAILDALTQLFCRPTPNLYSQWPEDG